MKTPSTIQKDVMKRVRIAHMLSRYFTGEVFASVLLVLSLAVLGRAVFFMQVLRNMPELTEVLALGAFFMHAFLHTQSFVQLLCVVFGVTSLWFIRRIWALLAGTPYSRKGSFA